MSLLGLSSAGHFGDEEITVNNYSLPLKGKIVSKNLSGKVQRIVLKGRVRCEK
jgi:hypothetical protein